MSTAVARVLETPSGWPVNSWAVSVITAGEEAFAAGERNTRFSWASISKLVVALGVHVAAHADLLALTEPLGPPGATVADVLAHCSGLGGEGTEPVAAPRTRRIYSNSGYDLLGELLAARGQSTLAEALHTRVLRPLGMLDAELSGRAASGIVGTCADLTRLAREFLNPTLLDGSAARRLVEPHMPGLPGVLPGFGRQAANEWGLGPEVRAGKSPHWTAPSASPQSFGHFGQAGGFLWVDPVARVACTCLTDEPFGPWALTTWPTFSEAVLSSLR